MGFSNVYNLIRNCKKAISWLLHILPFILLLSISQTLISQELTLDNYSGAWTDDLSWTDGSNPGTSDLNTDVAINGTINHSGDISTVNGDLTVNDTLFIYGDLSLGNNSDFTIANGGVVIVYGNYTSKNKVNTIAGGYFIVMGEFEQQGADDQGNFDVTTGSVFIYDASPQIKSGVGYADLTCDDPSDYPGNCSYGNESDLSSEPIFNIVNSGSFRISAEGQLDACGPSDSVVLSVSDEGDVYQWYYEGNPVPGADSFQYTARDSGDYYVEIISNSFLFTTDTVTFNLYSPPEVSFSSVPDVCENKLPFNLDQGSPAGGTYSGPGIILSPELDPSAIGAGVYTLTYSYTDGNGCADSATQTITVNSKPALSFAGLQTDYCIGDSPDTLTGNYAPSGIFIGDEITDLGNGTAIFTPVTEGVKNIYYKYNDVNGCVDSINISTTVHPIPSVQLNGLDDSYALTGAPDTLTGTPSGGSFSGNGVVGDIYDPAVTGLGEDTVVYTYTDAFGCINSDTGYTEVFDYDFIAGAITIPDLDNWFSGNAVYSTETATADGNAASCWNTSPNYNRWFKFQATGNTISILVRRGGSYGDIRRINAAIWEDDGVTEVSCNRYTSNNDDVYVESVNLTPGEWYYLSVDNNYSGYRGSFSLRVDTRVSYDYKEGAYELQDVNNWCSPDAFFTTWGATSDQNSASCWNTSPDYNRWFKFVATTHRINIEVKRGGDLGSIRRINVAIWENDGTTQINCNRYVSNNDNVTVGTDQLIPGNTYYISVDNNYSGYRGSFTLCVDDEMDYDYLAGAKDITTLINDCSNNAEYTTIGATPDEIAPSCWNTSPNYNRWFKFLATTSTINVQLKRGGAFGTLRRAQLALFDSDSSTVLDCNRYVNNNDNIEVSYEGLTPGEWYFISVDNNYSGYRGSFTLCLDDKPGYDFYEGAIELGILQDWSSSNAAYTTLGATPDKNAASCWNTGPNYNRWFKFTATTSQIHIEIRRGGAYGTVRRVNAAIWEADGVTEVSCKRYVYNDEIVEVEAISLVPGNTYYLSVDNNYSGYRGTFSLYVNDAVDYDFYEGARDVTPLINSQSELAEYTTIGATSDKNAGSCWNTSPDYNRWFKFRATTPGINIKVLRGGSYGSIRRVNVALFESDGVSELECNRYVNNDDIVELDYESLTPGNWYYFSVDNNYSGYRGTFTLALSDSVSYDYYEGAYELTDINNWFSEDAEFTTIGATPDKNAASCWNTSPNYNRWFKFTATTPVINVEVRRGGSYGTVRRINVALWEDDGVTQVACNRYVSNNDNVTVGSNTLTPGNTYYISVDNNYSGYRGTFSLYVDNSMDYDFYEGAFEITDLNGWTSAPAEFTTIGATPDKNAASCWNTSPNYNRWFKFRAIYSDVSIQVLRGGSDGTVRRINLALWDSDGISELACNRYSSNNDDVSLTYSGLTPGNWYYISVDNNYSGYRGTFTLQVNNVSGDEYYAIADGDWSIPSTWSLSEGGPPALNSPGNGDIVHIKGYDVSITGSETCAELELIPDNDITSLTIDAGQLTVNGAFNYLNSGSDFDGTINILNGGNLSVRDNFVMDRSGGANTFRFIMQDNSSFEVDNDLRMISSGGTAVNNVFTVSGTSTVLIDQDLILENTGGIKSVISLNNTAALTVDRDIQFNSAAEDKLEIQLNNTSQIILGRNIQRGAGDYGILSSNDNTTIVFGGTDYLQIIPENAGGGSDNFTYQNIEINNSRISSPQISLEGPVSVPGNLNLVDGVIQTSGTNLLTVENSGSISGGSQNSYIEGPVEIVGNSAVTFPVGKNGNFQPVAISAPAAITDAFIAEYFDENPDVLYDTDFHESSIDHIADCEYWTLERSSGTSSVNITAFWDGTGCCISDLALLKVTAWDGAEWKNYGNASTNGTVAAGDITSASAIDLNSYAVTFADNLPIIDFSNPAGPYCENDVSILLTGDPQDANGNFTGEGITDNGDGTATFNLNTAGNGIHEIEYNYLSVSGCSNSISKELTVNKSPSATMIGTDTVCIGFPVEFTIYLTGTAPWDITYTDGTSTYNVVTSDNPYKFSATNAGSYSVIALSDASGCAGIDFGNSAELVNWPQPGKPSTSIISGTTTFCEGENIVLETAPAYLYYWNNGVSTRQDTITDPGNYWVRIVDENGCFSDNSDTTTVTVNKTARKPSSISGLDDFCQNHTNTAYSTFSLYADTYNWDLQPAEAGIIIGNGSDIEINWDDTFSGTAKLSVYGSNANCGNGPTSDTLYISLDPIPDNPGPISGDQTVCQGQSGLAYAIDPVPNAISYTWTLPSNVVFAGPSDGNSITINYLTNAISGDISVTAINPCGASLGSSSAAINVQTRSTAPSGINITNNNICQGTPKTLTPTGGSLGTGAVWKWYLDAGCTISAGPDGLSLTVDPADTTEYWVRAEGTCNTTTAVSGTVYTGIPSVDPVSASSDRNNICPLDGNIILSYSGGSLGDGATAEWYDDSGLTNNIGSGNNLNIAAPASTTTYYVRFEGDCNNTSEVSVTVNINPEPSGNLTSDDADNIICNGELITFTATDGANYNFMLNGGSVQNGGSPTWSSALLNDGDVISIEVTNASGCTSTYSSITVTVNPLPPLTFSAVSDVCEGAPPFDLTQGSPAGGTYSGTGITTSPEFDPSVAGVGTHTITYTYTDANGCTNSATQTVTVNALPTVTFGALADVCVDAADFTLTEGSPAGGTYSGPGVSGDTFSPSTAGVGTHTLTYTYTDANGCVNSATSDITVNALPTVTFTAVPEVCSDAGAFDLTQGSPAGGTYSGTGITTSPEFDPSVAGVGSHTITYTYTDANGCSNSATQTVTVNALPTVTFGALADVCVDAADFTLTEGSPAGGSYSGTGVTGNIFSPSSAGPGTHTITYTYTDGNGCEDSATQTITVNALPTPAVNGPTESCLDGSGVFSTPLNANHSYSWSITGATASSPLDANPVTIEFNTPGTAVIQVTETNDITGCTSTSAEYNVTIYDKPTIGEIQSDNELTRR